MVTTNVISCWLSLTLLYAEDLIDDGAHASALACLYGTHIARMRMVAETNNLHGKANRTLKALRLPKDSHKLLVKNCFITVHDTKE
eukprot:3100848-Pleurochrysis_carterae.AAC.1